MNNLNFTKMVVWLQIFASSFVKTPHRQNLLKKFNQEKSNKKYGLFLFGLCFYISF